MHGNDADSPNRGVYGPTYSPAPETTCPTPMGSVSDTNTLADRCATAYGRGMNGTTFDTLAAAKTLREAGFENRQAEAVAGVMRHAVGADRDTLATKADLAALEARLYRALWMQGAGIVAVMAALIAALIAALELFG